MSDDSQLDIIIQLQSSASKQFNYAEAFLMEERPK
jgi:hypothetical protein